ncbi:MAG: amino acid-binding protein [Gammaproteobacteria bacterium]
MNRLTNHWFMLTVVGKDRPGIVARVTAALYEGGCNLGEASMTRLGGNFTVMLMVQHDGDTASLTRLVATVTESLGLKLHVDKIAGDLYHHQEPDVRIAVFGADRAGIVAQVTGVLAEAGLDILDLQSNVAGSVDKPIYIMQIEGRALEGIPALESAVAVLDGKGIQVHLEPIDIMIG